MFKTKSREYVDHGRTHRIIVTYGIDYDFARQHNQAPYFSLTCQIDEKLRNGRWREAGGGADHKSIVKRFPELAPLVQWHLTGTEGPMHYLANAKYWWEQWKGISRWERRPYDPDPLEAFKHTTVWGAVPTDEQFNLHEHELWEIVESYLNDRLPALLASFEADMREIGIWEN
ncbi:MAG: hypothetical protein A3E01_07930 [Gammaproteobacteria bacterium RIFCSPHIGHO2_12_FULL_63_22]|nr:MAG: hypothetical protein A3E01_07930 [Gammaproteobacteria bacterium RIFCSPHIGHO2_12_FULL_63_22]